MGRLARIASVAGGVCLAVFWVLVAPFATFAGTATILDPLQLLAQAFHLASAPLLAIGLRALFVHTRGGALSQLGYVLTMAGLCGFFGDAVIGLVINPVLARAAPGLVAGDGAMFTGPVLAYFIATFAILMAGLVCLALALWQTRRNVATLLAVGAVFMNLPPIPVLHYAQVLGGVAVGIAFAWMGFGAASRRRHYLDSWPPTGET